MKEQTKNPDLKGEPGLENKPRKSVMTYRAGLEVAMIMGIPLLVIILILKLAGC